MKLDRETLDESFGLLATMLEDGGHFPIHLVVTGGAALLATGIVSRTTHDVDVLAVRGDIDGDLSTAWPLPEFLKKYVSEIGELKSLDLNWLNASTSMMMIPLGDFPQEVWSDIEIQEFGESLKVSFVGRSGQIYLKMYAGIGRNEERDREDLKALGLSRDDALRVSRWIFEMELTSRTFPKRLFELLTELDHGDIIPILENEIS